MEAFNAEANVREQRSNAYKDRYVTVKPKGELRALRLEVGGELHHDDGSIVRLLPGDWAVESPDGKLLGVSAAVFDKSYRVTDDNEAEDARKARVQLGKEKPRKSDLPEPPEEQPDPEDIKASVLRAHEQANERVRMWADAAFEGELIDADERDAFIASNEFPAGLTVKEENGEWTLSRGEGHDVGSLADKDEEERHVDWTEKTAFDIKQELEARGVKFKAADSKGKLLEIMERSEKDVAEGGDGRVEYEPAPLPEPIVSTGADTADTAAREPHLPEHDPVLAVDPEPDEDDGRRPGGETRTAEDGEVQGAKEDRQLEEKASNASQGG